MQISRSANLDATCLTNMHSWVFIHRLLPLEVSEVAVDPPIT